MTTNYLLPLLCCIPVVLCLTTWMLCLAASRADDANEEAMLRKMAEDELDAKIGKAVRGETKWKRRMEDKR